MRTSFSRSIDELRSTLAAELPDDVELRVGAPRPKDDPPGVDITCLASETETPLVSFDSRSLPGRLTMLLSIRDEYPGAMDVLHDIWKALDGSNFPASKATVDTAWWAAHGVAPRPSVEVAVPTLIEQTREPLPMVEFGIEVQHDDDAVGTISGTVIGPRGRPLVAAQVVPLRAPQLATRTDNAGSFEISAVFAEPLVQVEVTFGAVQALVDVVVGEPASIEMSYQPTSSA